MAAIDKMYLRSYYDFDQFRLWCLIHNPSLLLNFYNWSMTKEEWDDWKEDVYKTQKAINDDCHKYCDTVEHLREHYKGYGYDAPDDQLEHEVKYHWETRERLEDKDEYIEGHPLPIACFRTDQDKYLLWRCPLTFIRDYLTNWCGYKEKWYHRLFFTND